MFKITNLEPSDDHHRRNEATRGYEKTLQRWRFELRTGIIWGGPYSLSLLLAYQTWTCFSAILKRKDMPTPAHVLYRPCASTGTIL